MKIVSKTWDASAHGEGFTHFQMKTNVHKALAACGLDAQMEYEVMQPNGYALRIDIAVPESRLAFEVQRGNRQYAEWRAEKLAALGWQVVFLHFA